MINFYELRVILFVNYYVIVQKLRTKQRWDIALDLYFPRVIFLLALTAPCFSGGEGVLSVDLINSTS